jgi:predicted aspartyl protease
LKAWIDEEDRAMVEVFVAGHARSQRQCIQEWIDIAFDGHLLMPNQEIERLGLSVLADTDAVLADGSTARLRCYYCVIDWMGQTIPVQVVENIGSLPLIGTALLSMVDLRINYRTGVCSLS